MCMILTACSGLCCCFFSLVAIPVYVKHNITFREGSSQGRFDLTLGPKQTMGKAVESVLVSSQLPRGVLNANLNPSQGTYTFDPVTKVLELVSECVYSPKKRRVGCVHEHGNFKLWLEVSLEAAHHVSLMKKEKFHYCLHFSFCVVTVWVTFA